MTTVHLPAKRKYRNQPCEVDGYKFASKREAKRYQELRLIESAGKISGLSLQTPYSIYINGIHVCDYRCDFSYTWINSGEKVVEDCKGIKTAVYRLKKKLLWAVHGILINEV